MMRFIKWLSSPWKHSSTWWDPRTRLTQPLARLLKQVTKISSLNKEIRRRTMPHRWLVSNRLIFPRHAHEPVNATAATASTMAISKGTSSIHSPTTSRPSRSLSSIGVTGRSTYPLVKYLTGRSTRRSSSSRSKPIVNSGLMVSQLPQSI